MERRLEMKRTTCRLDLHMQCRDSEDSKNRCSWEELALKHLVRSEQPLIRIDVCIVFCPKSFTLDRESTRIIVFVESSLYL